MIQVICADISKLDVSDYHALYEAASAERRSRADAYRFREDSLRCVTADALLRYALGTSEYTVEHTPSGKPFLKGREGFFYNLSHAGCWVVIAWGNSEVGVDVEEVSGASHPDAIARRFFTPEEQNYIFKDGQLLRQRFAEIWTGKESYLKFLGTGLKKELTSFSVLSLPPEIHLHHCMLPGNCSLTICTTEPEFRMELLDARKLSGSITVDC